MGKTLGYGEITVANMTEPFTVMLTNEAQQFATDSNRKVTSAQSYYTDIIVIRGSQERTDYTIGNITSSSGITVSKSSKRVTFSVSAGATIRADTGVIEIPITLDGQTVKKQFSWSCGKQGPQGVKGQDGTSIKITSKSVTYQTSTSGTTAPTGTWSTTVPTVNNGQYLWTKTTVQYSDGNKTEAYSVSYKGTNGTNGTSVTVSKTEVTYQVSTSGTTAPTGTWSTTMPSCDQGQYLWTKTYVKYSDGKDTTSYSVSYKGVDGEKFSWNLFTCSTLTDGDQENKANWRRGFINNSTHIGYTNDGFHFTTNEQGSKDSNGISFNISRDKSGLHVGDTVTFSVDIKGTIGTGNPQMQYWGSTKTDSSDWATRVFGDSLKTVKKDSYTRYSVTAILGDLYSSKSNDLFCVGGGFDADLYIKNIKLEKCSTATPWAPHPEDLEGRGVSETVQYYLATSQASGVTSSTSGWSTDITTQKLTADKKYLWNCYQTKYSDGTSEPISTPKVIGVYGDKGNGIVASVQRPNKTEFWWSQVGAVGHKDTFDDSSNTRNNCRVGDIFTVMGTSTEGNSHTVYYKSTTDSGDLAGECINHVIAESGADAKNLSITPSSQYFKSTDGGKTFAPDTITIKPTIQGEINFGKWQYSIDGGVSFADVVSGQKGLTISNNVLTVSKNSSLYSDAVTMITFRAVADDSSFYDTCSIAKIYDVSDIEIGGRNLLLNSDKEYVMGFGIPNTTWTDGYAYIGLPTTRINDEILPQNNAFLLHPEAGKTYTQTIWIETDADVIDLNAAQVSWFTGKYGHVLVAAKIIKLADNSYKLTSTHTVTKEDSDIRLFDIMFLFSALDISNSGTYLKFGKLKVEQGNVSTDWTPATEDVQTAILSTKSEISDVSLKVDKNKQAIEQRVEKTTYQQDLNLVKGDISKANEGLNKWRYEIYPKSLFDSTDQGKSTIDIFAKNKNLTPSRTVLFNDTDLSIQWNSAENYIGYALTFTKFSAAKSVAITFAHDDGAHIYLNGKLIGGSDAYSQTGESLTLGFVKGWNCIEVVVNDKNSYEGFTLGTTISAISECQLMNCYYGTPVARQSHITNQLVENTTNIEGVTTTMQKVMTTVGGSDRIDEFVNNYNKTIESEKQFKKTIGETYTTKDEFNGLEIGGRNLILNSAFKNDRKEWSDWGNPTTREIVSSNGKMWAHIVGNKQNYQGFNQWTPAGSIKEGDHITFSARIKGSVANQKFSVGIHWINSGNTIISQDWHVFTVDTTENIYTWTIDAKGSGCNKLNLMVGVSDTSASYNVYFTEIMVVKGNKSSDWTPAPEDNEINGQNLVSNLPANWEQGSINYTANLAYSSLKSTLASRLRTKDVFPVSGNITISAGTSTNSSKEALNFYYVLFDINKKSVSHSDTWQSLTSPKIINCGDAKYMAIILRWGSGSTAITPSDISQICLKIERGTSATPFTLAPEDVNGKIVNVETIANQTANKFSWIVKSGTSASNFEITDKFMNLVSTNINLDGIVSFMNTAKGDGRKNLYNLDYSSFENVASQEDAICYAKDNGVTSVGIDSSVSYDGDKSLKISYTTANLNSSTTPLYLGSSTNNYGCVKIQAGKQYILSCYVKSDSTTGMFMIDIQGHDTPDTKTDGLYLSNIDPRKLPGSSTGVNLSTDWQRAVCAIKVADNATGLYWSVVPLIWGRPSSSSAPQTFNVWVDCIMLEEVDSISNEPGTYIFDKETIIDGGSIKTDTITGNQILAGSITADKIATDAIKSHNYISSGGTQGSFLNLSDGSFTSPNLSWDSNGNLIAKNANLSGKITATNGSIAGWTIISNKMYTTGSGKYTGIGKYGSAYAFWAGATSNDNGNSAVFKVGHTGKLTATDADITGTITATNGKIGRYDITSTYLMTNSGSNASGIGGNQAFWAGAEDSNSAPFRVGYDGVLWAENAAIRGSIETGNLGDEGDTVSIINGHIGIQGTSNNVEIYSTGFKFGIDGDYYLMSVSEGVKCYRNLYATDFIADGWIYNASGGHYTWKDRDDAYISCGDYNGHNVYYYANYHAFYVNKDSGQGMMYINTNGVTSRVGFTKTSDERIKKNFESFDDNIIDAYMNIEPVKYQLKQSSNDNYHFGFKAQHVDKVFSDYGDIYNESFDICTSRPIDPDKAKELYGVDDMTEEYGLRYDELIAPTTYMVQHIYKELESTKGELAKVKQEKADLETRLQAIEAKLGL